MKQSNQLVIAPREPGAFGTAIYCRVSTAQQDHSSQLLALREYCQRRGWAVLCEVLETGSGAKQRPLREQLLQAARRQEIDAVVVYKLDRWGRSTADLVTTLDELQQLGVPLVSVQDSLDMTTSAGRARAGMLAVFAGFERDLIRERTAAGVAAARARGAQFGRPRTAAARTDQIRRLRGLGWSCRRIATELGVSKSSVSRLCAAAP